MLLMQLVWCEVVVDVQYRSEDRTRGPRERGVPGAGEAKHAID